VIEDKTSLIRCHRQFLVNVKAIKEIKLLENGLAEIITQSDHPIPVSRRYLKALKETLGFH
jgi:two-component system LytT family response regulator